MEASGGSFRCQVWFTCSEVLEGDSQSILSVGFTPTNWSRCFWGMEENNLIISDSSLRKRIIAHKAVKILGKIRFRSTCMVVVVPRRWLLFELPLGGDTIPNHTVWLKTHGSVPFLDNHFLYHWSRNSFLSSICIYLKFYHGFICSLDGDQGVVAIYVWLECICLFVIA